MSSVTAGSEVPRMSPVPTKDVLEELHLVLMIGPFMPWEERAVVYSVFPPSPVSTSAPFAIPHVL